LFQLFVLQGRVPNSTILKAILKQLDAIGTALSIVAMSWVIFHDYVIDSREKLGFWSGAISFLCIALVQLLTILVPNELFRGSNKTYYGISPGG
jgi:hypothetical protein